MTSEGMVHVTLITSEDDHWLNEDDPFNKFLNEMKKSPSPLEGIETRVRKLIQRLRKSTYPRRKLEQLVYCSQNDPHRCTRTENDQETLKSNGSESKFNIYAQ